MVGSEHERGWSEEGKKRKTKKEEMVSMKQIGDRKENKKKRKQKDKK